MICTDKFTFIHLHKAAGQTLNDILYQCIPSANPIGYHYPKSMLPEQYKDLPIVGIIRNPWDWYLSWYTFNSVGGIKNPLFNIVSKGKQADFKTTISNLLNYPNGSLESEQMRMSHAYLLPQEFNNEQGAGFTAKCIDDMQSDIHGYYGMLTKRMFGTNVAQQKLARFDKLNHDFPAILSDLGVDEAPQIKVALDRLPHKNKSNHSHYSNYYDDELQELVAQKEADLIKRFDFKYEVKPSSGPLVNISPGTSNPKVFSTQQNFYQIGSLADISKLKQKVKSLSEQDWMMSNRQTVFDIHQKTKSVKLAFEDMSHTQPDHSQFYEQFEPELRPILDHLESVYGNGGTFVRIIFAKLEAHSEIAHHVDKGYSLMNSNRVHIPLVTNEAVNFYVGGETKVMQEGEVWEINNGNVHAVQNNSDQDRIHLIIDWTPTETLLKEKKPYRMDVPLLYQPHMRVG